MRTAREFGYVISPEVALRSLNLEARFGHLRGRRNRAKWLCYTGALASTAGALLALSKAPRGHLPEAIDAMLSIAFFVAVSVLAFLLLAPQRWLPVSPYEILSRYHWEVWPCVVEVGLPPTIRLMRPDGSLCARLHPRWSQQVLAEAGLHELTHVWFAGDLRFGGVVASPGGALPVLAPAGEYPGRAPIEPGADEGDDRKALYAGIYSRNPRVKGWGKVP
ncbi:hypothetical protein [Embleya sp. NPDC001921]